MRVACALIGLTTLLASSAWAADCPPGSYPRPGRHGIETCIRIITGPPDLQARPYVDCERRAAAHEGGNAARCADAASQGRARGRSGRPSDGNS